MNPFFNIAFRYGLPLLVVYLSYRYIWKDALLNISFKGWGDLAARYRVDTLPVPGGIITMRIGSQTYNFDNMSFALAEQGMYLQRKQFGTKATVCIPYAKIKLSERPRVKKFLFFSIPVYGLFYVDGVDLWIDSPHAECLISHLPV